MSGPSCLVLIRHGQSTYNEQNLFNSVPFADHGAMLDPATADVSGRVLWLLGRLGFKKNQEENFNTMRWLSILHGLGCSIMIGASRKFGRLKKGQSPKDRMAGSVAASLSATQQGAQLLRVHDVAETQQALGVWRAMG